MKHHLVLFLFSVYANSGFCLQSWISPELEVLDSQITLSLALEPEKAAGKLDTYLELARNNRSICSEARGIYLLGELANFHGDFSAAIDHYRESRNLLVENCPWLVKEIFKTVTSEAQVYHFKLQFYRKALELYRVAGQYVANDTTLLAEYASNIGFAFFDLDQPDSAAYYLTQAYALDVHLNDSSSISTDLNNLGRLYVFWKDYPKGLEYYKRSLNFLDTLNVRSYSIRLNNIGMAYQEQGNPDSARYYIEAALSRSVRLGDSLLIAHRLNNLALVSIEAGQFNQAEQNLKQSLEIYLRRNLTDWSTRVLTNLAKLSTRKGAHQDASTYLAEALAIAERDESLENLMIIYQGFASHYEALKKYPDALRYHKKAAVLKDSIFKLANKKQLEEFNAQYASAEKEGEINRLALENEIQEERLLKIRNQRRNLLLLSLVMVLFPFSIFLYYRFRQELKNKEQEKIMALQISEIKQLRNQISSVLNHKKSEFTPILTIDALNEHTEFPLTNKEYEILVAMAQGLSNKEISEAQFISINTVKFHLKNIYDKMEVKNRVQAVQMLSNPVI